jgi:hypothetical protein
MLNVSVTLESVEVHPEFVLILQDFFCFKAVLSSLYLNIPVNACDQEWKLLFIKYSLAELTNAAH